MRVCVKNRKSILGRVVGEKVIYTNLGEITAAVWGNLPSHYPHVTLDEYIMMPDRFHGIVVKNDVGAGFKTALTGRKRHGLPEIVRAFKTFSSRNINAHRGTPGQAVWQRSYWDRIIRDDVEFNRIREYIRLNPAQWTDDRLYAA